MYFWYSLILSLSNCERPKINFFALKNYFWGTYQFFGLYVASFVFEFARIWILLHSAKFIFSLDQWWSYKYTIQIRNTKDGWFLIFVMGCKKISKFRFFWNLIILQLKINPMHEILPRPNDEAGRLFQLNAFISSLYRWVELWYQMIFIADTFLYSYDQ